MREEEGAMRYMSPLVKQDLAKLEKDGESRRVAFNALKQFVETLEPSSVPRFLAQVSEAKDTGGNRSYAISLYEEVARVHGKLIRPQIGRVMSTVTRSLSASGSSPQLHQACAKVVAAVVRYSIDLETSAAEAEEILREVSQPLVELLAGKMEPVSAGAATCMQALVESEKWKHASVDLVSEVCHRTTTAMGDKSTRTVAHMQLARSVATINPGTLSAYGACLLHAGEEALKDSANSWQHRKCAAKMVQAVMAVVDKETLSLELNSITQVLESCRHDRMPHVRTAVCEALQTAKTLASGCMIMDSEDGDHIGAGAKASELLKMTPQRRTWSSNKYSPSSQDSYHVSFTPPNSTGDSDTSIHDSSTLSGMGSTARMKRSPLFPSSVAASEVISRHGSLPHSFTLKENPSSHERGRNLGVARGGASMFPADDTWTGKHGKATFLPQASQISSLPFHHDNLGGDKKMLQQSKESPSGEEFTPTVTSQDHPKGKTESRFSPFEAQITRSFGEAVGDLMAEDEDILSGGSAELEGRVCGKNGMNSHGTSRLANWQLRTDTPESMVHSECVQSNSLSQKSIGSIYSDGNDINFLGNKGDNRSGMNNLNGAGCGEVGNRNSSQICSLQGAAGNTHIGDQNAGISHAQYMKLANMSNTPEDGFSALKPRVLITTADFLPYTTPRRLVLSLQSDSDTKSADVEKDDSIRLGVEEPGEVAACNGDADMDVESSSDGGWSVRDNPIASDESFRTEDSSEEEFEERQTEVHEALVLPRKITSVTAISPRRSWSPPESHQNSYYSASGLDHLNTPNSNQRQSNRGDDIGSHRLTPNSSGNLMDSQDGNLGCLSCTESQRKKSVLKAQEWDLGMNINRASAEHTTGTRRSMLFDQEPQEVRKHCCQGSDSSVMGSIGEAGRGSQGSSEVISGSVSSSWWNRSFGQSVNLGCLKLTGLAEAVLGGSLCVVVAVPIAMVLAKLFNGEPDCFLVPT